MELSNAERDTVAKLAEGKTPQEIASEMGVKIRTVRERMRDARLKLGATTTAQMIALFQRI